MTSARPLQLHDKTNYKADIQCEQRRWQSVNRPILPQPPTVNVIGRPMQAATHPKPCNDTIPGSNPAPDYGRTTRRESSSCHNHAGTSTRQQGSVSAASKSKRPIAIHAKGEEGITSTSGAPTSREGDIIIIEDEEPNPTSPPTSTSEEVHVPRLDQCQGSAAWAMAICTRTSRVDPEELWRAKTDAEIQALFRSKKGFLPTESPNHAVKWSPLRQPESERSDENPEVEEESLPAWRSTSSERSILNFDD